VYMDGSRITSNAFVAGSTGVDAEKHRDDDMMMNPSYNKTMSTATVAETMEVVFNYVPNLSDEIFLCTYTCISLPYPSKHTLHPSTPRKLTNAFFCVCVCFFYRCGRSRDCENEV
jgi:hypothetical protein